jgi:UDP-glucose 6-dehydrogenase
MSEQENDHFRNWWWICRAGNGIFHYVMCLDCDHEKIDQLKRGISPIYETRLETIL